MHAVTDLQIRQGRARVPFADYGIGVRGDRTSGDGERRRERIDLAFELFLASVAADLRLEIHTRGRHREDQTDRFRRFHVVDRQRRSDRPAELELLITRRDVLEIEPPCRVQPGRDRGAGHPHDQAADGASRDRRGHGA